MRGKTRARSVAAVIATGVATALVLSGCSAGGGDEAPELSDKPVTLRFTWWGNDARTAASQEVIAAFEKEYPNITIEPQFTDWAGYWDKLATETAANDAPDIIQMDEKYIATYGDRGALLDLSTLGDAVDTSDFPDSALATGKVDDALYGVPVGLTSYSIMANPALLEKAGVEVPDDKSWTWDDLAEIGAKVSAAGGGAEWGVAPWGFEDGGLNNWARQHGDALYTDGEVSIKPETVSSWYQQLLDMVDDGTTPPASNIIEKQSGGLAESFTATNTAAFGPWWNSQLTALSDASGSPLQSLRVPTTDGKADGSAYYKPSMYWSISSRSEHPAEAAAFVNFLANSEDAADILLTERGVPANEKIRAYIEPKLSDTDKEVVAFLDGLSEDVGDAPAVTPPGGSAIEALLKQYTEQVLFKQLTPDQAAEGFIKDLKDAIANA
ncbi:ABC transporter substrate-binding protein [Leifsonia sp. Leaf264]|uniref:ABC transporter substrate-binding protein n=1 Tax=Leifsonia sp. Leaf264 TaxID=1736314 RepID=UPI0009EC02ED|nr:sugar ABC transporter substrate-binding protein [Leifsonia sp. Leaf264]